MANGFLNKLKKEHSPPSFLLTMSAKIKRLCYENNIKNKATTTK